VRAEKNDCVTRGKRLISNWQEVKIQEVYRDGIFKLLRSPGIDSASLCSLACRNDNSIPTRFLAPIYCSKNSSTGHCHTLTETLPPLPNKAPSPSASVSCYTDKKEKEIFPIYKELQMVSVAKSYEEGLPNI
jgi:hypothetical protein